MCFIKTKKKKRLLSWKTGSREHQHSCLRSVSKHARHCDRIHNVDMGSHAPCTQCGQKRPCSLFSTPITLLILFFTTPIFLMSQLSRQDSSYFDEKIFFIADFLLRHLWQVFQLDVKKWFLLPASRPVSSCLTRWYFWSQLVCNKYAAPCEIQCNGIIAFIRIV